MIVAGIGCGRETSSEDIVSLIFVALSNFGIGQENVIGIAFFFFKQKTAYEI